MLFLNINNFKINRRVVSNKSSSSEFRITNKKDIKKLGEYIYSGKRMGLERKLNKWITIKNKVNEK